MLKKFAPLSQPIKRKAAATRAIFLLAMVMRFFLKIVASPARGENRMCSHPRTGDATDEKNRRKKSREIQ